MTNKHSILIAVPVYNEKRYIKAVLKQISKFADKLLVIDDGSDDGTEDILCKYRDIDIIRHQKNMGYGKALIDAFDFAGKNGYDWIITIDCDFQHEPAMLPIFYNEIKRTDADIISGSRYLHSINKSRFAQPNDRLIINRTITRILNSKLGLGLTDSFCGYKAYKVSSLTKLNLTEFGYGFPLQFFVQAVRADLKIIEIAVPMIYNDPGRCFGQELDNPEIRLHHYTNIIKRELNHYESKSIIAIENSERKRSHNDIAGVTPMAGTGSTKSRSGNAKRRRHDKISAYTRCNGLYRSVDRQNCKCRY